MKLNNITQSVNRSVLILALLIVVYVLLHHFVLSANSIVFQKPVIFENANKIESALQAFLFDAPADPPVLEKQLESDIQAKLIEDDLAVVYFWKSFCPCNMSVTSHYNELFYLYDYKGLNKINVNVKTKTDISSQNIKFYIADFSFLGLENDASEVKRSSMMNGSPLGEVLPQGIANLVRPYVSHTPSIAILSRLKGLIYYGPHQLGFLCNAKTSIIAKVILTFQQGIDSKNTNVIGEGCFCKLM